MSDKPKRRFWQIHLSTTIIMMFVAGILLWAQFRIYSTQPPDFFPIINAKDDGHLHIELSAQGWPAQHTTYFAKNIMWTNFDCVYSYSGIFLDLLVSFALLIVIGLVIEHFIYR